MSTVMTPEQFHTWSHHLQLTLPPFAHPYVSFAIGSSGVIFALITVMALRFGREAQGIHHCPHLACCSTPRQQHCRKTGLGMALPVSVLAANVPQLWVAYPAGNLADLSLGTWLLSMGDGLV